MDHYWIAVRIAAVDLYISIPIEQILSQYANAFHWHRRIRKHHWI
jgi:hypothetical protein